MTKQIGIVALLVCAVAHQSFAQYYQKPDARTENDKVSLGIGLGFDYGGVGVSGLVYPHNNIGVFVGGGYAIAGFGYNAGVKARLTKNARFHPYFTAMYGYNTAIAVTNASQLSKIFYGPSFGAGVDFRSKSHGYWTAALLVPIRGSDVDDYMNHLKSTGVSFANSLPPVGFSLGYRFVLE